MNTFSLIETDEEWDNFKLALVLKHGIEDGSVNWGSSSTPSSYPCLASGVIIDMSIICVFVYVDDAVRLLESSDSEESVTSRLLESSDSEESVTPEASKFEAEQTSVWNRHMVAFFLAMLHEIVSVGITKEERFGSLVTEMLSLVDQKHATDLSKVQELIDREFNRERG